MGIDLDADSGGKRVFGGGGPSREPLRGAPIGPGEPAHVAPSIEGRRRGIARTARAGLRIARCGGRTRRSPLEGASDAIASANLQSRIEELAASAGATISSTESLPAEVRGGYRRIGLRYVLIGSYETW